LSDEVFEEISSVSVALNYTDLQLSDEISTLTRNFGEEVQDRVSVDNIIKKSIEEKTTESIERDNAISNELSAYKLENENNIDQLTKDIVEKIEHDKHYTITHDIKGSALTDNYPFSCKDFAVNVYKTNVKDGIVEYTDQIGNTYSIGEIAKISNGYRFKTFDNIGSDAIISSINVGWTYDFVNGVMTVPAGKVNGYYSITLDVDSQTI
jgi:hypothetical protein